MTLHLTSFPPHWPIGHEMLSSQSGSRGTMTIHCNRTGETCWHRWVRPQPCSGPIHTIKLESRASIWERRWNTGSWFHHLLSPKTPTGWRWMGKKMQWYPLQQRRVLFWADAATCLHVKQPLNRTGAWHPTPRWHWDKDGTHNIQGMQETGFEHVTYKWKFSSQTGFKFP